MECEIVCLFGAHGCLAQYVMTHLGLSCKVSLRCPGYRQGQSLE